MGTLRLLLAIGVIAEHAGIAIGVGSFTAVEAFFMLSGFYMSLILSNGTYRTLPFYLSRALRIFPVFWLAMACAALYYWIASSMFGVSTYGSRGFASVWSEAGTIEIKAWYAAASTTLVGADAGMFFNNNGGQAAFSLLMPTIWTLSLEIYFYALCPLLIRLRSHWLVLIVLALTGARVAAYVAGLDAEPWHARFFPFELVFFLLGMLAHRWTQRLTMSGSMSKMWIALLSLPLVVAAVLTFGFYQVMQLFGWPPVYEQPAYLLSLVYCAAVFLSLPLLFHLTRNNRLDSYLGEYSYPLYLFHYMFVEIFGHSRILESWTGFLVVLGLSLVHAVIAIHLIQIPLDRYRRRRLRSASAQAAATPS